MKDEDPVIIEVHAEPVVASDPDGLAHLANHRGLIVRRALLASAISGFLPVPVLDEKLARRVRAGLYQKLARGRHVDLPSDAAEALATGDGTGALARMTVASAAAIVARFAGRKFLALLAAGRGAEAMASTFARATLFDHYCAKLHVGGPLSTADAERLRAALGASESALSAGPWLSAFRDGSRVLGRSLLEAPRWLSQRVAALGERFVQSGGNPDVVDSFPEPTDAESAWIERAAQAVEAGLARAGNEQLERMVRDFEGRWSRPGG
jgi:hypothetical protein